MGGGAESPRENLLLVLPIPPPQEILDRLKLKFPHVEINYYTNAIGAPLQDASAAEHYKQATILFTLSKLPTPTEAPNLRMVHLYSAGVDGVVKSPLFLETKIPFTNCSGVHGPQISEWIIMTMLLYRHGYNRMYESSKLHQWDRRWPFGNVRDVVGDRIGILGYGAIGRQAARVASSMGMTVLAYTATEKSTPESRWDTGYIVPGTGDPKGSIPSQWFHGLDKPNLHRFLAQKLDVLVICVPLTDDTHHFLSTEEFDILAQHPCLVSNIARGPIIDQSALVTALHDGRVAAAALDVTDPEPLPPSDPLWSAPNVIITPHISGASTNYTDRAFQILEQNLEKLQNGEDPINQISRRKGY